MEIKTSELTGTALDYAMSVCERIEYYLESPLRFRGAWLQNKFRYSTDWSQGGPIIEREKIQISPYGNGTYATYLGSNACYYGDTYLQAAMRCYVASKLGDVVEIPDELV